MDLANRRIVRRHCGASFGRVECLVREGKKKTERRSSNTNSFGLNELSFPGKVKLMTESPVVPFYCHLVGLTWVVVIGAFFFWNVCTPQEVSVHSYLSHPHP